jgi:hypothetical protein
MAVYEQLAAVEPLFKELREELWTEQDKEVLRARLREGPFGERPDGQPWPPDFPFEELTIGLIHGVALYAEEVYRRLRELFPLPPGSRVVTGVRFLGWEVREAPAESEPPSGSGSG